LADPRQRWIASRRPAMNPAFAIAEVIWIMNGRRDSAFLNYFNPRLPEFAGKGPNYFGAYGFRLRKAFSIDQLKRAAAALRQNSLSRQVVLQIWNTETDLPYADGQPADHDIPCNLLAMLKVRNGKLEWTQIMRSNDLFLGLPHNIVQFTTMQELIAGWIGVEPGEYQHLSDSLHLYERDGYVLTNTIKQPCPRNDDRLNVPEDESEEILKQLEDAVEQIISPAITGVELLKHMEKIKIPQCFLNLLAIMVADGCRRRQQMAEADAAVRACRNPCLLFLWEQWLQRKLARG